MFQAKDRDSLSYSVAGRYSPTRRALQSTVHPLGVAHGQILRGRIVPLVVACPMFLQNVDIFALTVSLPSMSEAMHVEPIRLNVIITAYLLGLAVCLPLSAWMTDRFGAKRMFCGALLAFSMASLCCGLAASLPVLVACRLFQGISASMMMPVGRLILVRTVPPANLMHAMIWYSMPPVIGRLAGPLLGGLVVSVASWHWIFFLNVPFGLICAVLAAVFVSGGGANARIAPIDWIGLALLSAGLAAELAAFETVGKSMISPLASALLVIAGALALVAYGMRSRGMRHPVLDTGVLAWRNFRANATGAIPLRLGLAGMPFLLPLMFELGCGFSPLTSGVLLGSSALGAVSCRFVVGAANARFGVRPVLLTATALTTLLYVSYAVSPFMPILVLAGAMFLGGLFSSMCIVTLLSIGFLGMPKERMNHANVFLSMTQQLTASVGVAASALLLATFAWLRGGDGFHLERQDYAAAILAIGICTSLSIRSFARLKDADLSPASFNAGQKP